MPWVLLVRSFVWRGVVYDRDAFKTKKVSLKIVFFSSDGWLIISSNLNALFVQTMNVFLSPCEPHVWMCFLSESFPYVLSKRNRSPIWPSLQKNMCWRERELISARASQGNYGLGGARQHDMVLSGDGGAVN